MTFDQIWAVASRAIDALLIPVLGALGIWGVAQVKRWQAKTDLKTMQDNSAAAVRAVEQLYPTLTGPEKKQLALSWANHLNSVAGVSNVPAPATIVETPPTQVLLNEGNVKTLPKDPVIVPVIPTQTPPATYPSSTPPPPISPPAPKPEEPIIVLG